MRRSEIFCSFLILLLPLAAMAQQTAPQMNEETKKMMEEWTKLATPGEQHKIIAALAGNYSIASKSRFDAESPFMENTGTCDKQAVLGGRYVSEHCQGPGQMGFPPFEGMGIMGFNNYAKEYEFYWFDNMSTMAFALKGTSDAVGKVITMTGSYPDPVTKKSKKAKWVWTIQDANHHKLELYDTDSKGKEFLTAEIDYTRK